MPTSTGTLTVMLFPDPAYDGQLYARSAPCTTGAQVGCADLVGPGEPETLTVAVTTGVKLFVFVDGKSGSAGGYQLSFHVQ